MGTMPMEIRTDTLGEKLYASRNHNHLRQTYADPSSNRTIVDWTLTLRQVRKPVKAAGTAASMPNLHTADIAESRKREPLAPGHPDGPFHCESETLEKYQNLSGTCHMTGSKFNGLTRVSSGATHSINWQCNLRDGAHIKYSASKWKRHYARPQQSFDMLKENCSPENVAYQNSQVTPHDRRIDRRHAALPHATIRDDPISFKRWAGCEGTSVGAWRHLIEDRSRGYKARRQLQYECTLRENPEDPNGARIMDNRSDGCIMEMSGKKKWLGATSHDHLVAHWPHGDAKLYHLSQTRLLPEADEENRALRMSRHPRTDALIPETREKKESTNMK
mmetsp:Transcript_7056/g.13277  ORF Transcript_7056/g.13277 Transcript_7056/m.13277 type:complete len:333 (-) Transcript_7056:55-1053(-)